MCNQKEQDEIINNFLDLSRFATTSGNSRKSDGIVNARIAKNTNVIPL